MMKNLGVAAVALVILGVGMIVGWSASEAISYEPLSTTELFRQMDNEAEVGRAKIVVEIKNLSERMTMED